MIDALKNKEVIFFDIGYTLISPASGDWFFTNKFNEIVGEKIKNYTKEEIKKAIDLALEYLENNHFSFTIEKEIEDYFNYYSIVSNELKLGLTKDEINEISIDHAKNMDNFLIYPEVKETIKQLSKKYKLGIISDTWPSADNELKKFDLFNYFTSLTYSCFLGVFKPNEKMFLDAINKAGCDPSKAVFIDDLEMNLDGASKLGITPILIARIPKKDVDTKYSKIYTLKELL